MNISKLKYSPKGITLLGGFWTELTITVNWVLAGVAGTEVIFTVVELTYSQPVIGFVS